LSKKRDNSTKIGMVGSYDWKNFLLPPCSLSPLHPIGQLSSPAKADQQLARLSRQSRLYIHQINSFAQLRAKSTLGVEPNVHLT